MEELCRHQVHQLVVEQEIQTRTAEAVETVERALRELDSGLVAALELVAQRRLAPVLAEGYGLSAHQVVER